MEDTQIQTDEYLEKCRCEAQLFYEKYKNQLDALLQAKLTKYMQDLDHKQPKSIEKIPILESGTSFKSYDTEKHVPSEETVIAEEFGEKELRDYEQAFAAKLDYLFTERFETEEEEEVKPESYLEPTMKMKSTFYKLISQVSFEGEEESFKFPLSKMHEEWMSKAWKRALRYLQMHRIHDVFRFLGSHLLASNPKNPITFLIELLDSCLDYRAGYCEPPLLFKEKHIVSLFDSMDPMKSGYININQYHTGMFTLGIKYYNRDPICYENKISKNAFVEEALKQLIIDLNGLIQCIECPQQTITYSTTSSSLPSIKSKDFSGCE